MTASLLDRGTIDVERRSNARYSALPRTVTTLLITAMIAASLAPTLLPRSALTQAIVTGVFAASALAASAALHRLTALYRPTWSSAVLEVRPIVRRITAASSLVLLLALGCLNVRWQNDLRAAMELEATTALHWGEVVLGSISVFCAVIVAVVGAYRGARRITASRITTVVCLSVLLGATSVLPSMESAGAQSSPSTQSDSLGQQGRTFVSGTSDASAVRTYAGLGSASTVDARAKFAVDALERAGGLDKSHIVVAVPTGSGWVDDNAVVGFEERFDGDVATVALQYSDRPSWTTFLFARQSAQESASALLGAVRTRLATIPEAVRPDLFVYGQSLGAIGGSSAIANDPGGICGALWAGPPAGIVASGEATMLANSSDPVVWWSTELAFARPDLTATRLDAPVPQWLPFITYVQTSVDLVSALNAPDGHGHRYGRDQGTQLPDCS